ncbi:MAG: hypothetical protein II161_07360 [Erysipelotrichaceae bacterium]|nr:hypothetical protein [Erysipelotrichaceae bacterium]
MGKQVDPRSVKYNGEYGVGPDGGVYNRKGQETWGSEYNRNVRETKEREKEARLQAEQDERRERERRENYEREQRRQASFSGGGGGGSSFSFAGLFGGILAFFAGYLALIPIVLILMAGAIIYGILKENSRSIKRSVSGFFATIGKIFTMPFTAWPTLWKASGLFRILEIAFALGIIIYTIKRFRNDRFFLDTPYIPALIGFVLLELVHHFFGGLGIIASLYNGLCLAIPVLIILKIIDTINDRRI